MTASEQPSDRIERLKQAKRELADLRVETNRDLFEFENRLERLIRLCAQARSLGEMETLRLELDLLISDGIELSSKIDERDQQTQILLGQIETSL